MNGLLGLQLAVDGMMGPASRDAVRDFQRREGLPVDGIAGPETKQAIIAARTGQATGRPGQGPAEPEPRPDASAAPDDGEAGALPTLLDEIIDTELAPASSKGGPRWILHDYSAHRTELRPSHREQLVKIRDEIVRSFDGRHPSGPRSGDGGRHIRCVRLIGHAATWRGISKTEYGRRALARAQGAAEELSGQLSTFGLVTKIFLESDDLDLGDKAFCEPVSGIDVALIVGGRADDQPLVPNLTHRTDGTARKNRARNRRVEVSPHRTEKKSGKKKKKKCPGCGRRVPPCNEPGAVCVLREGDEYEGLDCWWPGKFWDSAGRLDELVEAGKARYICDSR